ncbi:alpha/beta hydrolase [Roseobacteraceae bacterium S113]
MHHGATDSGDDPGAFGRVWTHRGLAEELMDRGFAVAVPQRRGRGGSTGDYAEGLAPAPALGYSCLPEEALKGFARAQEDVAMAMDALFALPTIDARQPAVLIGNSRGGALALDWAGQNPERTRAVINFVGGWVEESCAQADAINAATLANAPAFTGPSLWLYGSGDVLYGPEHTQSLFAKHIDAGGRGAYHLAHIPWEGSGHQLISYPPHYQAQLNALLARIAPAN